MFLYVFSGGLASFLIFLFWEFKIINSLLQAEGRGFESRLPLILFPSFFIKTQNSVNLIIAYLGTLLSQKHGTNLAQFSQGNLTYICFNVLRLENLTCEVKFHWENCNKTSILLVRLLFLGSHK